MKRRSKISRTPFRNRSPFGWWIASYIERFEWADEDRANPRRRCMAWENTILIQAATRHDAWRKAIAIGRLSDGNEAEDGRGRAGKWRFEGLTSLLPIYEQLEHGAEILWTEHRRTVVAIKAMVRRKAELDMFDDRNITKRISRRQR